MTDITTARIFGGGVYQLFSDALFGIFAADGNVENFTESPVAINVLVAFEDAAEQNSGNDIIVQSHKAKFVFVL